MELRVSTLVLFINCCNNLKIVGVELIFILTFNIVFNYTNKKSKQAPPSPQIDQNKHKNQTKVFLCVCPSSAC